MLECLREEVVLAEPPTCKSMQLLNVYFRLPQALKQSVSEKLVVPIPLPLVVQGDDKQVRPL